MSIKEKLCEVNLKILQLQSMLNAIRCIDQRFAYTYLLTEFQILTQPPNLHCFGELELGPGQHLPTCAGLAHGQRL